jgi:hypothetical protein
MRHGLLGLVSIAMLTAPGLNSSAFAQTLESTSQEQVSQSTTTTNSVDGVDIQLENHSQNIFPLTSEQPAPTTAQISPTSDSPNLQTLSTTPLNSKDKVITPIPGTVATSTTPLNSPDSQTNTQNIQPTTTKVAQTGILPGRATRGGRSYIGVGANIGLGGDDSALGDGNFAVISKIGLTKNISIRPSAVIADNAVILLPLTYDFSIKDAADPFTEVLPFAPYIGAGAAIKTGNDSEVGLLLSGGVDFPLGSRFTANASVNAGFFDDVNIGLLLGIGFNFPGF